MMLWLGSGDFLGAGGGGYLFTGGTLGRRAVVLDFGGGGFLAFFSEAFSSALDGKILVINEFNDDILLVDAGQFAFKDVTLHNGREHNGRERNLGSSRRRGMPEIQNRKMSGHFLCED
jgi:hypothetical protein